MDVHVAFRSDDHYRLLREKLITFFARRRCADPEGCADECVARMLEKVAKSGPPANVDEYVFGFARKLFLEWTRQQSRLADLASVDPAAPAASSAAAESRACAEAAISTLSQRDRDLMEEH